MAVTVAEATPDAFVVAVVVVMLAPDAGPVNVTVTPETGLPPESFTVATNGFANAALIVAVCPPPLVALMEAGVPAVLVSEKVAGVATPATVAFTV